MKKHRYFLVLILALSGIFIISCSGNGDSEKTEKKERLSPAGTNSTEHDDHHGDRNGETVVLTDKQMETAGIVTSRLEHLPLKNTVKSSGFLELPPQNKADVSTVMSGQIRKIYVREGDKVNKSDLLAELSDPAFQELQADYRKSASKTDYLGREYRRKKRLYDENIGSEKTLERVRSEYESVVAEKNSLESKLKLVGLDPVRILEGHTYETVPVKSPIDGYVRVVKTNTGEHAAPNEELFEIVDNAHIHIDLMVYEKDIHRIKTDQEVLFKYTNQPGGKFYKARIFSVGKAFEDNPRVVRVHAEPVDHEEGLLPGMFVEGHIITGTETVPVLPEESVLNDSGENIVFMLKDGSHDEIHEHEHYHVHEDHGSSEFIPVRVKTGINDAGYTEVSFFREIPGNALFVTGGAYYLLSEMKKGEGGHSH